MTNEEAIKILKKARLAGIVDANINCALDVAIKALEQTDVLDKIREEIESCREYEEPHLCDYRYHRNEGLDMALDIIDKYKAESEGI